eukprot:SAG25_NODE_11060_length_314_cov_1.832558_1_plen_34_part_10
MLTHNDARSRDQAVIPWKQDILAFKKYFREKYTP